MVWSYFIDIQRYLCLKVTAKICFMGNQSIILPIDYLLLFKIINHLPFTFKSLSLLNTMQSLSLLNTVHSCIISLHITWDDDGSDVISCGARTLTLGGLTSQPVLLTTAQLYWVVL